MWASSPIKPWEWKKMTIKKDLESAINAYLKAFEVKYDGEFDEESDLMEVRWFGDYFFTIDEIIHDVDNPQHEGEIFKWWNEMVDFEGFKINFKSWCRGVRLTDIEVRHD
jgi:hypothetical protein